MDILSIPEVQFFIQLFLAFLLGALIGIERAYIGKEAGTRTFALISLGSALFTILSRQGFLDVGGSVDPSRIAAGIVVGIGFLGSGVILFREAQIEGLTTAAALWSAGAIGMAVGAQFFTLAIIATFIIIIVLSIMRRLKIEVEDRREKR